MNYLSKGVLTGATIAALLSLPIVGHAGQAPVTCDTRASRVNAVKLAAPIENTVDFSGSNGAFDPIPLLVTAIDVGGRNAACVIARFSAQVNIGDNTVVFQASIDDNPMEGHTLYPEEFRSPQLITPIVLDKAVFSQTRGFSVPTTVSYNFFMTVKPGAHTVRIKWAGCCSSDPASASVIALAAVLTVEYRGGDGTN
jgi:hypothetical protein